MRWLSLAALAALALALLALMCDRTRTGEDSAAPSPERADKTEAGSLGSLKRTEVGDEARTEPSDPWPGLRGEWLYRCPVEVRFTGAPAGQSVHVSGPGLPANGWSGATADDGVFRAPELAVGEIYSFTIGGGWFVVPRMGYDVLGPGSLAVEAYAPPGPTGAHLTKVVAAAVVRGTERVRLLDARDGRLLVGAQARAVRGGDTPVRLVDGNAEWTAVDGTIPIPLPTRTYDEDPDLVVISADGSAYEPLPLGPPALAAGLESGALILTPAQEFPFVRLLVFRSDGTPATGAEIVASGRELARADRNGLAAFDAPGSAFTISAPGHREARLNTAEWGSAEPNAAPRHVFLEPLASWTLSVDCPDPRALTIVAQADARLTVSGASWTRGGNSSAGSATYALRNRTRRFQLLFEAPEACEVRVRCTLWQTIVDDFVLKLTPGRPEASAWRPPPPIADGMKFRIVDAAGAEVPEAQVWLGLREQDAGKETPLHEPIALDRDARAEWSLPWWPDRIVPALRVSAAGLTDRVLTVRELQEAGGTVTLQPRRSFRVQVLDEAGAAVLHARLSLVTRERIVSRSSSQTLDGLRPEHPPQIQDFEVRDAGGIVDLLVTASGYRSAELRHDPTDGDLIVILKLETRK